MCRAVAYIPLTVLAVPASVLTVYTSHPDSFVCSKYTTDAVIHSFVCEKSYLVEAMIFRSVVATSLGCQLVSWRTRWELHLALEQHFF